MKEIVPLLNCKIIISNCNNNLAMKPFNNGKKFNIRNCYNKLIDNDLQMFHQTLYKKS